MRHRQSLTFIRFFKLYVYLFLSVCVLFSILNVYSIAGVQKQMYEYHELSVQKTADDLAAVHATFERIAESIAQSPVFCSYNLERNLNLPHNIRPQMDMLCSTADGLSSLGIIYTSSLYEQVNYKLFSSAGTLSLDSFCASQLRGRISGSLLRQTVDSTGENQFLLASEADAPQPVLLYLMPVPSSYISSPAVLLFELDYNRLIRNLGSAADGSDVFVYDRTGRLLLYSGPAYAGNYARAAQNGPAPDSIMLERAAGTSGLRVCQTFDRGAFYRPLVGGIASFLIILAMACALGFTMSYAFAQRALQPIRRLVQKASPDAARREDGRINELEVLDQSFDKLTSEFRALTRQVSGEADLMQRQLLLALLAGRDLSAFESGAASRFLQAFDRPGQTCVVFALMIEQAADAAAPDAHKAALCAAFEERCAPARGFAAEMPFSSGVACVLLADGGEAACWSLATNICDSLHLFAAQHNAFTVTAALSRPCRSLEELPACYSQAVKNAEYRFFLQGNETITPHYVMGLEERRRAGSSVPVAPDGILHAVKSGGHDAVEAAINEAFSAAAMKMSLSAYKFVYFDLLSALGKMLQESFSSQNPALAAGLETLYRTNFDNLRQAKHSMTRFCCELSDKFAHLKGESGKGLYARILLYLEASYTAPELSLSSIAQEFSVNPSYLTRYFKEKNGCSLMQYIDHMRFETCKQLLLTGDRPVKEIVERVGYVDEANFSRKFKKLEGVSPTRYRQMHATELKHPF